MSALHWMSVEDLDRMLPESHGSDSIEQPRWLADKKRVNSVIAVESGVIETEIGPTFRTLADITDDPPGALLLGMLEPDGPNLLYALGGTGKGSTGAWMIRELQSVGMKPMVFDAERRSKEWARRCSGLGVDRSQVVYVEPEDLPHYLLGRPIWEVAPHLAAIRKGSGSDILFVDSVLPATGKGEETLRSDAQTPYLYVQALDALGIPSVSFGHPPKGQPEGDPFGSVAWVNAHRLTWVGSKAEYDGHRVRWRPRKRNERGHIAGVLLTFHYDEAGRLSQVLREDDEESTREWLLAAIRTGARSVTDLAEELADQGDDPSTEAAVQRIRERLRQVLRRMERDGAAIKTGKGKNTMWALKWQS